MVKLLFKTLLLNILLLNIIVKTKPTEEDYDKTAEEYKNNYIKEFRQKVKDYLTKKNLYKNDKKLISKEEFKEIFTDIMSDGDESNVSEGFGDTFKTLTDEFTNDAFPDGIKYMKGSEIHKHFEYENIIDKFNKHIAKISQQYNPNNKANNHDDL